MILSSNFAHCFTNIAMAKFNDVSAVHSLQTGRKSTPDDCFKYRGSALAHRVDRAREIHVQRSGNSALRIYPAVT